MIILILFYISLAIDLTQLHSNPYTILNHTDQFKIEVQIDNTQNTKKVINTMPQDQFSQETRMNQILYEQEEKAQERKIIISDKPVEQPYKIKYDETQEEELIKTNAKIPKKKLQEETIQGEPILDVKIIAPIATRHKITLLIIFILILCILILMREMYEKWLHKIFQQALWKLLLETLQSSLIIIIFIILYYNNYFDFWLLNSQFQQHKSKKDILLIEIHDYDENYKYNIFAYLLIAGGIIITLFFISIMYIFIFDTQMYQEEIMENKWNQKQQLAILYKQQKQELLQYQEQLKAQPNEQLFQNIKQIEQIIIKSELYMDFFLIKLQFLQQMSPYFGPRILSNHFLLNQYLAYLSIEVIQKIIIWDFYSIIIFIIFIFILTCLLQLINIIIVNILCNILLFIMIINLNYIMTLIQDKSFIKKDYTQLEQEELQVIPPFMEPIFENILPKKNIDIQSNLYPFGTKNYITLTLSLLIKISTTLLFITNVYLIYWINLKWYWNLIINIITIAIWLSILFISKRIIKQFINTNCLFIRNYNYVYAVIKQQKHNLSIACHNFYELIRFIRKKSLQNSLNRDNLLLLRPIIVDIIELCKRYSQNKIQQVQFDPREIELVDLGIESIGLIHIKHLSKILKQLTQTFTERDLKFIQSFCQDTNSNYFSPIKLILYLHLRQQEIYLQPIQIMKEVFEQVIPLNYKIQQEIEENIPDNYINQGLDKGELNIELLKQFLIITNQEGFFDEQSLEILISHLQNLKSQSISSICLFIYSQISQLPF